MVLANLDDPVLTTDWQGDPGPLVAALQAVAPRSVLTSRKSTEPFRKSFRGSLGDAAAVVRPVSLLELWRVIEVCVAHDAVIIMQAQNTGLTNGSTPDHAGGYDRPVVIINTLKLDGIQLLDGGKQAVSFPGGTLYRLEQLLKPLGREPHSVIGSSCVGASIVGGVCNNSGGSLVRRGPAYTELALYAQLDADGRLHLVNHLGIELGKTPEEILTRLERGDYTPADIAYETGLASDSNYAERVRDVDEPSAARFNADPTLLHEASGSAGKLCVFAVRIDTFPAEDAATYYVGTNDPRALTAVRRRLLTELPILPSAGEYMHRGMFDACRKYGRDTFLLIHYFTTNAMPAFFGFKRRMDATLNTWPFVPKSLVDRIAQFISSLWPEMLPKKIVEFNRLYEHQLMMKVAGETVAQTEAILTEIFGRHDGAWFRCTEVEGERAFLHRFSAGGAVARYKLVHSDVVEGVLPLDVALRRNDDAWHEPLPPELADKLHAQLVCAHFFCHVFHLEYVVKKGVDMAGLKEQMLAYLEKRGAKYPAEHNVGQVYEAGAEQLAFYRRLDPSNAFNPGIGKTTKLRNWRLANDPHAHHGHSH